MNANSTCGDTDKSVEGGLARRDFPVRKRCSLCEHDKRIVRARMLADKERRKLLRVTRVDTITGELSEEGDA